MQARRCGSMPAFEEAFYTRCQKMPSCFSALHTIPTPSTRLSVRLPSTAYLMPPPHVAHAVHMPVYDYHMLLVFMS